MILVAFELSMPGKASWNGKWTGEGQPYVRIRNITKMLAEKYNIAQVLKTGSYNYRWDDGWCACVTARKVDGKEAAKLRKQSAGFCGYDWMIDSILEQGYIESNSDRRKKEATP